MKTAEQIKKELAEMKKELEKQTCQDWIDMLEMDIETLEKELKKISA